MTEKSRSLRIKSICNIGITMGEPFTPPLHMYRFDNTHDDRLQTLHIRDGDEQTKMFCVVDPTDECFSINTQPHITDKKLFVPLCVHNTNERFLGTMYYRQDDDDDHKVLYIYNDDQFKSLCVFDHDDHKYKLLCVCSYTTRPKTIYIHDSVTQSKAVYICDTGGCNRSVCVFSTTIEDERFKPIYYDDDCHERFRTLRVDDDDQAKERYL